jgi:hypothetical protein
MPVTGQTITVSLPRSVPDEEGRRVEPELLERFSRFSHVLLSGVGLGVGVGAAGDSPST